MTEREHSPGGDDVPVPSKFKQVPRAMGVSAAECSAAQALCEASSAPAGEATSMTALLQCAENDARQRQSAGARSAGASGARGMEGASASEGAAGDERRDGAKKRRRSNAPQESCPYCSHSYTVRDGLSTKVDMDGNRLHMRKCQCREKTPPCRNCPRCKEIADIMQLSEPTIQYQLCQARFQCDICACRCPGSGKWVETDSESRRAYAQRTEQRHGQLSAMGWYAQGGPGSDPAKAKALKRLPADIREQMEQLLMSQGLSAATDGEAASTGGGAHEAHSHANSHAYAHSQPNHNLPALLAQQHGGSTQPVSLTLNTATHSTTVDISHCTKCIIAHARHADGTPGLMHTHTHAMLPPPPVTLALPMQPQAVSGPPLGLLPLVSPPAPPMALPDLPQDVYSLVLEVFEGSSGPAAVAAVAGYLQAQRVTAMGDLEFMELPWLQEAMAPHGLPPLLLNKLLKLARTRAAAAVR